VGRERSVDWRKYVYNKQTSGSNKKEEEKLFDDVQARRHRTYRIIKATRRLGIYANFFH
jgi:hypothetical protein